jgi:hypothetical protein
VSIYIAADESEPSFLCSNTGWGEFCRWADELDAEEFPEIVHLCDFGWCQHIHELTDQLQDSLADAAPDVASVGASLIEAASAVDVLVITDGLAPSTFRHNGVAHGANSPA